ncbi:hypothetical protein HDC36_004554 [Xanthomonas sp. JAI131]|jgi:hypothetical protein|nr:hypothetical protein [Xanthomonas sp. JAI131]
MRIATRPTTVLSSVQDADGAGDIRPPAPRPSMNALQRFFHLVGTGLVTVFFSMV